MTTQKNILYLGLNPPKSTPERNIVHYPVIKIIPRPPSDPNIHKSFQDINKYTHIIFTSQSSIKIFFEYLSVFKLTTSDISNKIFVCVGTMTAEALRKHGIAADIIAQNETAEGIIEELSKLNLINSYFLWPRSALARDVLTNYFKRSSIKAFECPLYDTTPFQPGPLPDLTHFHEIIFTSPSTVDAFKNLFPYLPKHLVLTPIGPITKKQLLKI